MPPSTSCPSCHTPLALFTPREAESHVNACLDNQEAVFSGEEKPTCAVCRRDLSSLTTAARGEHANRCADTLLPLPPVEPRHVTRRRRGGRVGNGNRSAQSSTDDVTRSTEAPLQALAESKGDVRVEHLLKMLGLERYASRFAREEIDLVALRLLTDDDLAALSIPEAARRRLAEAMHSVPILAQLQRVVRSATSSSSQIQGIGVESREVQTAECDDAVQGAPKSRDEGEPPLELVPEMVAPPPTQRFVESRLGARMAREKGADLDEISDEEEYAPTPYVPPPVIQSEPIAETIEEPSQQQNGSAVITEEKCQSPENGESNDSAPNKRTVSILNPAGHSSPSELDGNMPSLSSDLADIEDVAQTTSQISVDNMLRKWRRRLINRERARHKRELERIEEQYTRALKRVFGQFSSTANMQIDAPSSPVDNSIIDLTQDPARETVPRDSIARDTDDILCPNKRPDVHSPKRLDTYCLKGLDTCSPNGLDTILISSGSPNAEVFQNRRAEGDKHDNPSSEESGFPSSPPPPPLTTSSPLKSPLSAPPPPLATSSSLKPSLSPPAPPQPVSSPRTSPPSPTLAVQLPPPLVSSQSPVRLPPLQPQLSQSTSSLSPIVFKQLNSQANRPVIEEQQDSDDDFEEPLERNVEWSQRNHLSFGVSETVGRQHVESDDDILDLIGSDQGNEFGPAMDEELEEERSQSRLKKKRRPGKATDEDVIRAIRSDEGLYQDILMMECTGFSRILQCIRSLDVNISKKSLHDFLVRQGVMFKGDAPVGEQSKRFLNKLNSDHRNPSE